MRPALVVLLAALPLAGCLDDAAPASIAPADPIRSGGRLQIEPLGEGASSRVLLDAPGQQVTLEGDCPCAPIQVVLGQPVDEWNDAAGWLEIRLSWDGTKTGGVTATMVAPNGTATESIRGFDGLRVFAWKPGPGTYSLEFEGAGPVSGWMAVSEKGARQLAGEDLVPNLQTLVPTDLEVRECHPEEQTEQGATRCMRLSNGVANTGDGPLEVRLDVPNGALAVGGLGRFVQRLYTEDGGFHDVEVGAGQFHLAHMHFHYAGLAHFVLYDWDAETGLRGSETRVGHKAGFCFLDWAPMHEPEFTPDYQGAHASQDCLVPTPEGRAWAMGISPSWYDLYWSDLADQYIDIAGVPDGTYEMVSIADAPGTLIELDESDNAASVIMELKGDQVTILEERGFYTRSSGDL